MLYDITESSEFKIIAIEATVGLSIFRLEDIVTEFRQLKMFNHVSDPAALQLNL